MKRFYKNVKINYRYEGTLFSGVSFIDHEYHKVKTKKELFYKDQSMSNETSDVCGTQGDSSSEWIFVGGPIKGSYVVKDGEDLRNDFITDFGVYVEDPCQAADNKRSINLNPASTTVKDLKHHNGTESQFWLPNVC